MVKFRARGGGKAESGDDERVRGEGEEVGNGERVSALEGDADGIGLRGEGGGGGFWGWRGRGHGARRSGENYGMLCL